MRPQRADGGSRGGTGRRWAHLLEPYLYLSPGLVLLTVVLLVPLVVGISFSFRHLVVYEPRDTGFVGLENYRVLLRDRYFWQALGNTLRWSGYSVLLQFLLGLGLALLLNRPFPGRRLYQALVFLPWAVPAFLSGLAWAWMFNPVLGPLPHVLHAAGVLAEAYNILADPRTSLWGPITANVWFGIPFFAITLLAALQAIPNELHEAAQIDGAGPLARFRYVTLPFLAPTIAITVLLRTVWIANFPDLIWVMTGGGPANSSQILPTYIFTMAYSKLDFGYASAVASVMLLLLMLYGGVVIQMRRQLVIR